MICSLYIRFSSYNKESLVGKFDSVVIYGIRYFLINSCKPLYNKSPCLFKTKL